MPATSVFSPRAIAAQNRTRSSRHAIVGAPGEGICPRYRRVSFCRFLLRTAGRPAVATVHPDFRPMHTSVIEVLRRPVESTQFRSNAFVKALRGAELRG